MDVLPQVSQIDIVPTLSLLLDQPIPFSNLGTVIPDILLGPHQNYLPEFLKNQMIASEQERGVVSRLFQQINAAYVSHLNAKQLFAFIDEYQASSKDLPLSKVHAARVNFDFIEDRFEQNIRQILSIDFTNASEVTEKMKDIDDWVQEFHSIHELFQGVLQDIKNVCRGVWAKFDVISMTMGISLMTFVACFVLTAPLFFSQSIMLEPGRFFGLQASAGFLFCVIAVLFSVFSTEETEQDSAIVFLAVSFSFSLWLLSCNVMPTIPTLKYKVQLIPELFANSKPFLVLATCFVAHSGSYFANSYIIHEDTVVLFLVQSFVMIRFLDFIVNVVNGCKRKGVRSFSILTSQVTRSLSLDGNITSIGQFMLALVCLRTTKYFWFCREMQLKCNFSSYVLPLASLLSNFTQGHVSERLLVAFVSMITLLVVTTYYLRRCGNLNGNTAAAVSIKFGSVVVVVFMLIHWFLQIVITHPISKLFDVQNVQQIVLPRLVYLFTILSMLWMVIRPIPVFLHWHQQQQQRNTGPVHSSQQQQQDKVFVYGLKTVYSSSFVSLLFVLFLMTCMVMMDGIALPMLCLWCTAFVVIKMFALKRHAIVMSKCWRLLLQISFLNLSFICSVSVRVLESKDNVL